MESSPSNLPTEGQTFRRVEVLSGLPRRRRWSAAEKASIVAESLVPGAVARQVALGHGLHANQLYSWRRALAGANAAETMSCGFVPVALSQPGSGRPALPAGGVAIEIAGAVVRVSPGVGMDFLRAVLAVVKEA